MWPFRKRRQPVGPAIDPAYGNPEARALIDALEVRDWRTARDILVAATDPDVHAFLMEAAAGVEGVQEWIGDWVDAEPRSTLPVLVRGCHAVRWAWQARGGKRAGNTSQEQFREFGRRLRIAENLLDDVLTRDPDEVTARAFLVTSSRGRQVGADEARYRFDEVVKRHPTHVLAHEQRLQYLCGKWFGSHEEMFAFARESTVATPDGSLLQELIAVAHIEKWLSMPREEDDEYIQSDEVRAELLAAAERSILHPDFRPGVGWVPRASTFALSLELAHEFDAAGRVFDLLGDHVSQWPWSYCGEPVAAFVRSRAWVQEHRS